METLQQLETLKDSLWHGSLYDSPCWYTKDTVPTYFDWFDWSEIGQGRLANGEITTYRWGTFRNERVRTLEQKIWFLKGLLENKHCGSSNIEEGHITFANSTRLFNFTIEVMRDVMFKFDRTLNWSSSIATSTLYLIPICHSIKVEPNFLKFIKDYELVV